MDEKNWKQKVNYFWDYHKWKVIISVAIIIFLASFISSYVEENKEPALYIAMVNAESGLEAATLFTVDYPELKQIDTDVTPIRLEYGLIHPKVMDEKAAADNSTVASIQTYQGLLISERLDVTISTTWMIEEYSKANAYCDLQEIFSEEYMEEIQERVYYCQNQDGKEIPVGILLDDKEILGTFREDGKPVLTISAYSHRKEAAAEFAQWVIDL